MYIDIDAGLRSALAVLAQGGALVALHDTPILTLSPSRGHTVRKTRRLAWWRS